MVTSNTQASELRNKNGKQICQGQPFAPLKAIHFLCNECEKLAPLLFSFPVCACLKKMKGRESCICFMFVAQVEDLFNMF